MLNYWWVSHQFATTTNLPPQLTCHHKICHHWESHRSMPKFEAFYRTVDRFIKLNDKRLCAQQLYHACRWQMSWSYFTSLGRQKFEEVSSVQNLWQPYVNFNNWIARYSCIYSLQYHIVVKLVQTSIALNEKDMRFIEVYMWVLSQSNL